MNSYTSNKYCTDRGMIKMCETKITGTVCFQQIYYMKLVKKCAIQNCEYV